MEDLVVEVEGLKIVVVQELELVLQEELANLVIQQAAAAAHTTPAHPRIMNLA